MKLVGLMLARNEDWVIGVSLRAALEWCDSLVVVDHASTDLTERIICQVNGETFGRVHYSRWDDASLWSEMEMRQHSLLLGRKFNGTHFAIVDADEILTYNLRSSIRSRFASLVPGQALEVPMIPIWGTLDQYRDDESIWSRRNDLSLGFADRPDLTWCPASDGYDHHHRLPYRSAEGYKESLRPFVPGEGGVMHLQFVNKRRLLAKHVLYRMIERIRWPNRDTSDKINWRYDLALDERGMRLSPVCPSWWARGEKETIKLDGFPWQEAGISKMIETNGREIFSGLDLKGF